MPDFAEAASHSPNISSSSSLESRSDAGSPSIEPLPAVSSHTTEFVSHTDRNADSDQQPPSKDAPWRRLGLPTDFLSLAESTIQAAKQALQPSPEPCSPTRTEDFVNDLDRIIADTEKAKSRCDPHSDETMLPHPLLLIQGRAYVARFKLKGDANDLHRSISTFKMMVHTCSRGSPHFVTSRVFLLDSFLLLCHHTRRPDDLDRMIEFAEQTVLHLRHTTEPNERAYALRTFIQGRLVRMNITDGLLDRNGIVQLCRENIPFATGFHRSWLLWATSQVSLSPIEWKVSELKEMVAHFVVDGQDGTGGSDPTLFVMFLWGQLRFASVAGDAEAANFIFGEICSHNFATEDKILRASFDGLATSDLDHCICRLDHHSRSVALSMESYHLKPFTVVLTNALLSRVFRSFSDEDPDIAHISQLLTLPPNFMSEDAIQAAVQLWKEFPESCTVDSKAGSAKKLDWIITRAEVAMRDYSSHQDENHFQFSLSLIQGCAYRAKFGTLGDPDDLRRSISALTKAVHVCDPEFSLLPVACSLFPEGWRLYTQGTQDVGQLDRLAEETIPLLQKKVESDEWDHLIHHIVRGLLKRTITTPEDPARNRGVQLWKKIPLSTAGSHRLWLLQAMSQASPSTHFDWELSDLQQMMGYFDENGQSTGEESNSLEFANFLLGQLRLATFAGDRKMAHFIFEEIRTRNLVCHSNILQDYFDRIPSVDLDQYVQRLKGHCLRFSLELPTMTTDELKPFTFVLLRALNARFHRSHGEKDWEEASLLYLHLLTNPSPLTIPGLHNRLIRTVSNVLFGGIGARWKFLATSNSHQQPSAVRGGEGMEETFRRLYPDVFAGDEEDTSEEAFARTRQGYLHQLSASPNDSEVLFRLGLLYSERYTDCARQGREGDVNDLQKANSHFEQARNSLDDEDDSAHAWRLRESWAESLLELQRINNKVDESRLILAFDIVRRRTSLPNITNRAVRYHLVSIWLSYLNELWSPTIQEHCREHVAAMYEVGWSLLEEMSWLASSVWSSMNDRERHSSSPPCDPAPAFLSGDVELIVEAVERPKGLVWNQLIQLRAPLDKLAAVNPGLASRLHDVSSTFESRWHQLDEDFASINAIIFRQISISELYEERNQVLKSIRALPGFEDFLKRRPFNELRSEVANEGPVVILTLSTHRSFAVILHYKTTHLIRLQPTREDLQKLRSTLTQITSSRDAPLSTSVEGTKPCNDQPSLDPESQSETPRFKYRKTHGTPELEDILEKLWTDVAEPVLSWILRTDAKGEDSVWQVPDPEKRKRIWWSCHDHFSFLPIHVAGKFRDNSPICVSDFFVSSYTPTLEALIEARNRPIPLPCDIKVLAAIQPAPNGRTPLPKAKEELNVIAQAIPHNLIYLGDSGQLDFDGRHTSVENVVEKLPEAAILHLACHGTQDRKHPAKSGFILADGKRLTIQELIKHRVPNAYMAILSACHTASNDNHQPEETMNLSRALLFLGYRSILGTKWPMSDLDGPVIAKAVYQALSDTLDVPACHTIPVDHLKPTSYNPLASFSLAKVIDDLVRDLRINRKLPAKRWATFVHIGA